MSYIQVYVKGLPKSVEPADERIESMLDERYGLSADDGTLVWAGRETTLVKRDDDGCCRGFAFLSFYSSEGAAVAVDRINTTNSEDGLTAELSKPNKTGKKDKKKKKEDGENLSDLRMRKQRKAPVRKHPVITSSNGKRTGLGNKTK